MFFIPNSAFADPLAPTVTEIDNATGRRVVKCDACEKKISGARARWFLVPGRAARPTKPCWTICAHCAWGDTRWIHHAIYPECRKPTCDMWDAHSVLGIGVARNAAEHDALLRHYAKETAPAAPAVTWASETVPEKPPWSHFPHCPSCHRRLWAANRLIRGPHPVYGTCPHCDAQVTNNEGTKR